MELKTNPGDTHFYALGGMNEVGKNTYILENEKEIVIIDAGMKLSEDISSGVDAIIPDYSHLVENKDKISALLITHGHEDHIGGIPYLLQQLDIKTIWAPRIAMALIHKKLEDKGVHFKGEFIEYGRDAQFKTKDFTVDVFEVNHSIPDSFGFIIEGPNNLRIMHTGDFKFDFNPLGLDCEMHKITAAGEKGIDLLVSDSTGAMSSGWTNSESKVSDTVTNIFKKAKGRVMIAAFASNIYRVKQIVEIAHSQNKKIVCFGRSMIKVIDISRQIGLIDVPASTFIDKKEINKVDDKDLLILSTGSQGEQLAALSRIAAGQHANISIKKTDTIVLSSSPIPGNRSSVAYLVNSLYKQGATVFDNAMISTLHTSGHASREELRLMLKMSKPKNFVPMHGEYAMLEDHVRTAIQTGVKKENNFIIANGDVLTISKDKEYSVQRGVIPAEAKYIDGKSASSTDYSVIKDRIDLGEDGVVAVYITLNSKTNKLEQNPAVLSRGCFYADDNRQLIYKLKESAKKSVQSVLNSPKPTFFEMKKKVKQSISQVVWRYLKKKPMVVPVIINSFDFEQDKGKKNAPKKQLPKTSDIIKSSKENKKGSAPMKKAEPKQKKPEIKKPVTKSEPVKNTETK